MSQAVATAPEARASGAGSAESQPARTLLALRGVSKTYGERQVLHGVDLELKDGEFLVVLGPSGSGKTTVLRLIGGFIEPSGGTILLDGTDIARLPINRRPFNTVFQDYALFPHMTVAQNVGYGLMVRGVRRAEIRQRVKETLELVALGDFAGRHPTQLSGGQQQRVALARAIICRPRLILLDEPLGALDAELRRQMQRFLKNLQREIGISFLFITHDQEEAITMADRICVMRDGRIVQVDVPSAVYYRPSTEYVARFFGDNNLIPGTLAECEGGTRWLATSIGRFALPLEAGEIAKGSDGQKAMLVVRPEAIRLAAEDPALVSRLVAKVLEVSFVGPVSQVLLQPRGGDGPPLMAKLPSRAEGLPIAAGQEIEVGWRLADTHAVPA